MIGWKNSHNISEYKNEKILAVSMLGIDPLFTGSMKLENISECQYVHPKAEIFKISPSLSICIINLCDGLLSTFEWVLSRVYMLLYVVTRVIRTTVEIIIMHNTGYKVLCIIRSGIKCERLFCPGRSHAFSEF